MSSPASGQWMDGEQGLLTQAVHAGQVPDAETGAILAPVVQSTTFVQESIDKYLAKGFSYTRSGNPTVAALERKLALLDHGEGAVAFSTGMAATSALFAAFLKTGDHCVITNVSYGGTNRIARVLFEEKFDIKFSFIDFRDTKNVEAAIQPNTRLIFSETPSNPTLDLADIEAISKLAKSKGIPHICDATFATPVITQPLKLGADMVLHSTTKYVDGHNITVGGAIVSSTKELDQKVRFMANVLGSSMSPQVAFYQLCTVKTMPLRVRQQSNNAMAIAKFLKTHPKVDSVRYPGLEDHPQHELAKKQHQGGIHGGMLSFEVKGGTAAGRKLMDTVPRPWSLCENLGATESIITCPAVMTHANMRAEDRAKLGITDGFVRVSAGIEDADDLIRALKMALDAL